MLLGLVLRLAFLGQIPQGLHRDEAFLGYNAYSILKTGSDISGNFLPIHLESFYFSPNGYSYFSIPFILIFGLNSFSIRLASFLFGSLTIPLIYFLSVKLFEKNKNKRLISLLSALFLAISPWHINLSRTATDNVIVLFFITLAVWIYVSSNKNVYLRVLSYLFFGINTFIYQAPRAFTPLLIPILFLFTSWMQKRNRGKLLLEIVLFLVIIIAPILIILSNKNLTARISDLSILNHPQTKLVLQEQITIDSVAGLPYPLIRLFHNKITGYFLTMSENYFKHFSFDFLFLDKGFPDRYRIPGSGLLYIFQLPLILIGLFLLFKKEIRTGIFLLLWLLISFVGSALTFDDIPNLQRTLFAVVPFSILSAYGAVCFAHPASPLRRIEASRQVVNMHIKYLIFSLCILFLMFNFLYYIVQYYIQGKVYRPWYRQDGYKELVENVNTYIPSYKYAIITSRETAPTIFFLFFGKYDPALFQNQTKNIDMEKWDHVSFANYRFSEEECPLKVDPKTEALTGEKGILYVNSSLCKDPKGARVIDVIKRADGSEVFRILDLK